MKLQNFLVFSFVVFSFVLNAQITSGTKYLGGSLGFTSSKAKVDGAEANTDWTFAPEFGYFFKDNMAIGVNVGISGGTEDGNDFSGFSGLVYLRKFWNASEKFHIFAGLNVTYGSDKFTVLSNDFTLNTFGALIDMGIWYNLSDKWSVAGRMGALGFASTSNPDDDDSGVNTFGLNVNTTQAPFSLGLYYGF